MHWVCRQLCIVTTPVLGDTVRRASLRVLYYLRLIMMSGCLGYGLPPLGSAFKNTEERDYLADVTVVSNGLVTAREEPAATR